MKTETIEWFTVSERMPEVHQEIMLFLDTGLRTKAGGMISAIESPAWLEPYDEAGLRLMSTEKAFVFMKNAFNPAPVEDTILYWAIVPEGPHP